MNSQQLKHLTRSFFMLMMALVFANCSSKPTWEDAQKKLDQGEESDAARMIMKIAEDGDVKAMDWSINFERQFRPIQDENFSECDKETYNPTIMSIMEKRATEWPNGDLARILNKFYTQSGFHDEAKAQKWAKVGADKGDGYCLYIMGESLIRKGDYTGGLSILEKSAAKNCKEAVLSLYQLYSYSGNTFADSTKAEKYCVKAAELGNSQAKYEMARRYFYGDGIKKDVVAAHNFITGVPDVYILDKTLPSAIDKAYKIALNKMEEERYAAKRARIKDIINGGTIWQRKESDGVTHQLRFCSNHILIYEEMDLYDPDKNCSVSLKYKVSLSDPYEPNLTFTSLINLKGASSDWANSRFGGSSISFTVNGSSLNVSGNHVLSGTYIQLTR